MVERIEDSGWIEMRRISAGRAQSYVDTASKQKGLEQIWAPGQLGISVPHCSNLGGSRFCFLGPEAPIRQRWG